VAFRARSHKLTFMNVAGSRANPVHEPDPIVATTTDDFLAVLKELRSGWAAVTFRDLERASGLTEKGSPRLPMATTANTLNGKRPLDERFLRTYVEVCYRVHCADLETEPVVERWLAAWRRLDTPATEAEPVAETGVPVARPVAPNPAVAPKRVEPQAPAVQPKTDLPWKWLATAAAVALLLGAGAAVTVRLADKPAKPSTPPKPPPGVVSGGDINGDGIADLISLSPGEAGKGTYTQYVTAADNQFKVGSRAVDADYLATQDSRMVTGDFDGDKLVDTAILRRTTGGRTDINLLSHNAKQVRLVRTTDAAFDATEWIAADLDNDGRDELVTLSTEATGTIRINEFGDATANFGDLKTMTLPTATAWQAHLVVADFNGDRKADILLVLPGKTGSDVFSVTGDLNTSVKAVLSTDLPFSATQWAAGDTDHDGKAALLALADGVGANGSFYEYVPRPDGSFGVGSFADKAAFLQPASCRMVVGDFDGDKAADVLILTRMISGQTQVSSLNAQRTGLKKWMPTDRPFGTTEWSTY
jgi:hypothetical protein